MENKQNIQDLIQKFYPHAKEKLGFEHPVRVIMRQDAENAKHSLGKTAYYDPAEKLIVLYITNRHPKDVLRSFSHELVHHAQNCRGELDDLSTDDHYAKDGKGREIEKEAYLQGNFNVRDYEDNIKFQESNHMSNIKEQEELGDIIDKLYDGPRDKKGVPLEKPPLKKDWKKDPIGRKQRIDFRKWYMTYGPGFKKKDSSSTMGGMTNPEAPATDDPSLDYQTKAPDSDLKQPPKRKEEGILSTGEWETLMAYSSGDTNVTKQLVGKIYDDVKNKHGHKAAQILAGTFDRASKNWRSDFRGGDSMFGARQTQFDKFDPSPYEYEAKLKVIGLDPRKDPSLNMIKGYTFGTNLKRMDRSDLQEGINKMKITKRQLKSIIQEAIGMLSEGKGEFPDLTGDGEVTQADILKGRGVKMEEQEQVPKEKPPLPKNWRSLPTDNPQRVAFRKWYTTHGPGAKKKKDSTFGDLPSTAAGMEKAFDKEMAANIAKGREKSSAQLGAMGPAADIASAGDLDKAMAKAQGVDVVGEPVKIASAPTSGSPKFSKDAQDVLDVVKKVSDMPASKEEHMAMVKTELMANKDVQKIFKAIDEFNKSGDETMKNIADFINQSISDENQMAQEIPQDMDVDEKIQENNDIWYSSNLYESLKSRWTKKGDK